MRLLRAPHSNHWAEYRCNSCWASDPIKDVTIEPEDAYRCQYCKAAHQMADFLNEVAQVRMVPWQIAIFSRFLRERAALA